MSDSVRPHRWQPTRLPRPWDSPGKSTVVGCHFLLQCMKVKRESELAQFCPTLSDPMECSLPGSSIHGIFQARVLEWVPLPSPNDYLNKCKGIIISRSLDEAKWNSHLTLKCRKHYLHIKRLLSSQFYGNGTMINMFFDVKWDQTKNI